MRWLGGGRIRETRLLIAGEGEYTPPVFRVANAAAQPAQPYEVTSDPSTARRLQPTIRLLVIAFMAVQCAAGGQPHPTQTPTAPSQDVTEIPTAPWERLVDGAYENRGVAQVERIGDRWALSVLCDGTHTTYLDDTAIVLTPYLTEYVKARYRYVERTLDNVRCIQAPCGPVVERRIALERLTRVSVAPEEARSQVTKCDR